VLQSADDATNIVSVTGNLHTGFAATFNIAVDESQADATGTLSAPSTGAPPAGGPSRP